MLYTPAILDLDRRRASVGCANPFPVRTAHPAATRFFGPQGWISPAYACVVTSSRCTDEGNEHSPVKCMCLQFTAQVKSPAKV